jgi:hypothetical protein
MPIYSNSGSIIRRNGNKFMSAKTFYKATNLIVLFVLLILKSIFFFKKKHDFPKIIFLSLTKNQINQNHNEDFLKFMREDRFDFNLSAEIVLTEVRHLIPPKINRDRSSLVVTKDLFLYLVLHHVKFKNFVIFYRELCSNLDPVSQKRFNVKSYKREVFDLSVWNLIVCNIKMETFLITTPSHMNNLPIIFKKDYKKIRKVMMWYSTNSVPINRIGEAKSDKWLNKDVVKHVSEHFVWNSSQALDLEQQGIRNCKIVGSILFYPRKISTVKERVVTYFDVTPLSKADTVYSENSCISALIDITDSINDLNEKFLTDFTLRVKPKRNYSKFHSRQYISKLKELQKAGKLEIADWSENLYSCVSRSTAVLSVPYSSPIEIGIELDVPGAYYFDGNSEWELNPETKSSPLFTSKSELKAWLEANVFSA